MPEWGEGAGIWQGEFCRNANCTMWLCCSRKMLETIASLVHVERLKLPFWIKPVVKMLAIRTKKSSNNIYTNKKLKIKSILARMKKHGERFCLPSSKGTAVVFEACLLVGLVKVAKLLKSREYFEGASKLNW